MIAKSSVQSSSYIASTPTIVRPRKFVACEAHVVQKRSSSAGIQYSGGKASSLISPKQIE